MDYKELLKSCETRLATLRDERAKIDREMVGLTKTIDGLRVLAQGPLPSPPSISPPPVPSLSDELGFTDKVRTIVKSDDSRVFSATEIRDVLVSGGEVDSKVLLVQVHNTLKRLVDQDELIEIPTGSGKVYRCKSLLAQFLDNFTKTGEGSAALIEQGKRIIEGEKKK